MHGLAGDSGLGTREEAGLATRAAWLYHAGGLTQSEVAGKLGVTSAKAHRLIGRARRAGLVRVFVEGPIGDCIGFETALSQRYDLSFSRVVPSLDEPALPLRALGTAAAIHLREILEQGRHKVIGVGHGRTLAAVVDHLPPVAAASLQLVSLLGGLPRRHHANPYEVVDRLAEKTGADAHMLPVPMFARQGRDREVLRRQTGVPEALALAGRATLVLLGIGESDEDAFLLQSGAFSAEDMRLAHDAGAVGEALGYFYDAKGRQIETALHARNTGLSLAALAAGGGEREVLAVAGGVAKAKAIHAVLRSRLLTGLITDELTARQLVAAKS